MNDKSMSLVGHLEELRQRLIYSALAILGAYVLGAIWGAGHKTMRLAAGTAHGSGFQERVIMLLAYSSAPTGIIAFALIFWELLLP